MRKGTDGMCSREVGGFLNFIIPVVVLILFLLSGCGPGSSQTPPDVIIITVDTLRADRLGCYGYFRETSPNIDKFAEEDGVLFKSAVTPMATTLPAHISLFTSTNPLKHGVKGNYEHLKTSLTTSERLKTAAQFFKEAGYDTAGFVGATSVKKHTGIDAGFQTFGEPEEAERKAEETTDKVLNWFSTRQETKPFFLWIHYFDPHGPYLPPPPFNKKFEKTQELRNYLIDKAVNKLNYYIYGINNLYDGEVLYTDSQIGRLFKELKNQNIYEDSIIVFTSDHGEGLGQHKWVGHGRIYNEQLFVPLIIKFPKKKSVSEKLRNQTVSLIDVLPTLVKEVNLDLTKKEKHQFEGFNILNPIERKYVFSERVNRERDWEPGIKYALTGNKWKYFHLTEGADKLFDIKHDFIETKNVIEGSPEVAGELKKKILKKISSYKKYERENDTAPLPSDVRKELESLGYIK